MKYEWRKKEKELYLPKEAPQIINVPAMQYLVIVGEGDPNEEGFSQAIQALYAFSYAIKMSPRKGIETAGYFDYTVFPLEAIWDSKVIPVPGEPLDKSQFIYQAMIRQPDFVTEELLQQVSETVIKKIGAELAARVSLQSFEEGKCLQILHVGPYDDEPRSFQVMTDYCHANGLKRTHHQHREIYLSDARKTEQNKMKTVLRFAVK